MKKNLLYSLIAFAIILSGLLYLKLYPDSNNIVKQESTSPNKNLQTEATSSTTCYQIDVYATYGQKLISSIPNQTHAMFLEDMLSYKGNYLTDGSTYTEDQPGGDSPNDTIAPKKGWPIRTETYGKAVSNSSQNKLTDFYAMNDRLFVANNLGKDYIILYLGSNTPKRISGDILIRYATSTSISLLYPNGPVSSDNLTNEKKCSNVRPYNFDVVTFKIGNTPYNFNTVTTSFTKL